MRKITLLFLALLAITVNAKNVYTTTTLWEDTYTDNIAIPASSLATGATITVYMTVTEGIQLRTFYCLNYSKQYQKSFKENGGTIEDWKWQNAGTKSYSFNVDATDMTILNNTTEETGSTGYLYIGSADASKLTITKITKTETSTENETNTTTIWSGSETKGTYAGLDDNDLKAKSKEAKKGDVFRVTTTNAASGNLSIRNANGWGVLIEGTAVAQEEAQTIDFEITTATILEAIQTNGIIVYTDAGATFTKVELLTYASSYDCVPVTIGSDGIATFSSVKDLDFTETGVTPYYVSAVAKGTVTLTATTNATTWNYCGYILQGSEGTYDVPVTTSATYPAATFLQGMPGNGTVAASTSDKHHYIFAKDDTEGIGFYNLAADHELAAKKAYLETTTDIKPTGGARIALVFDDELAGISDVKEQKRGDANAYYNLNGMRVVKPTKGLYIKNGKKVIVK